MGSWVVLPSMRAFLFLSLLVLAVPACAGYGPADPASRTSPVTGAPSVRVAPSLADDAAGGAAMAGERLLETRPLVVPVAGIEPARLSDSYSAGRDGGARRHNAIDIMAPRGTPVVAADSGRILRLSRSALGGITIYATDPAERLVYYYAHLAGYRDGLEQGMAIARGDTLGFVGSTGNASADAPHLHFQVMLMPAERRNYWNGEPVNPFPVLVASGRVPPGEVRQAGDQAAAQRDEQPRPR